MDSFRNLVFNISYLFCMYTLNMYIHFKNHRSEKLHSIIFYCFRELYNISVCCAGLNSSAFTLPNLATLSANDKQTTIFFFFFLIERITFHSLHVFNELKQTTNSLKEKPPSSSILERYILTKIYKITRVNWHKSHRKV
jgi:hypothetical protein